MDLTRLVLSLPRRTSDTAWRIGVAGIGLLQAAEQVPILMIRLDALLSEVERVVQQAGETARAAGKVVARVDSVQAEAGRVVTKVDVVQQRAATLIDGIEPLVAVASTIDPALIRSTVTIVENVQPLLRAATLLKPDFPDQAAQLVSRVLPLVEELGPIMFPLLRELEASLPEIREILNVVTRLEPVMTDVETRIAGLPGASMMRKRGVREIEASMAEDAEDEARADPA